VDRILSYIRRGGKDTHASAQIVVGQLSPIIREIVQKSTGSQLSIQLKECAWYSSSLEDRDNFAPANIRSGFAFPIGNTPQGVQWFTYLDLPPYFLVIIRDLFLKGSGICDRLFEYGRMALLEVAAFTLSVLRIR
jgi:hypothetical protein